MIVDTRQSAKRSNKYGCEIAIFLNGKLEEFAVYADDEAGIIQRYKLNKDHKHKFEHDDNGETVTEFLRGDVKILMHEDMIWAECGCLDMDELTYLCYGEPIAVSMDEGDCYMRIPFEVLGNNLMKIDSNDEDLSIMCLIERPTQTIK